MRHALAWPGPRAGPPHCGSDLQNRNQRNRKKKMQTTSTQNPKFTGSPTQFAFPAPTIRQVSLAGDFNNWDTKAAPMQKGPDGIWRLSLPLGAGRYEYRFYA